MGFFLVIRFVLQPWLGFSVLYLQFFPAIILTAHLVGFGPGILATVLATAAAIWFFLAPTHTFTIVNAADQLSVVLFFGIGCALVTLVESARRSEMAARQAAAAADEHARQLDAVFQAIPRRRVCRQQRSHYTGERGRSADARRRLDRRLE